VSRLTTALARIKRRVARNYHLICAREDLHTSGLNIPAGVWFCDPCRQVWWEPDAFHLHLLTHPA
jgi:hypothetical protein